MSNIKRILLVLVRGAGAETARLLRRAHRADNY
jgi:hypothetical protein